MINIVETVDDYKMTKDQLQNDFDKLSSMGFIKQEGEKISLTNTGIKYQELINSHIFKHDTATGKIMICEEGAVINERLNITHGKKEGMTNKSFLKLLINTVHAELYAKRKESHDKHCRSR